MICIVNQWYVRIMHWFIMYDVDIVKHMIGKTAD